MRRHPNRLLHWLLAGSLLTIALMHPATVGRLAQLAVGLALAIVQGAANAAADQPGPAAITGLALYVAHQIHTHRPRARAHH